MTTSGSTWLTKSLHPWSNLDSSAYERICRPSMGEHEPRVKTLRMNGSCSPRMGLCSDYLSSSTMVVDSPRRVTILAIWMTESIEASGNALPRISHSISKLKILNGASFAQFSFGGYDMKSLYLEVTGWMRILWQNLSIPNIELQLAVRYFSVVRQEPIFSGRNFYPVHAHHLEMKVNQISILSSM